MALAAQDAGAQSAGPIEVTPEVRASIDRGLRFLALTQNNDGSWRANGGQGGYPVAMTALAGTALLASGSTPTRGRYWLQVRRATDFLLSCAQNDGFIAVSREVMQPMFGHGFATLFLAQVYGMEEDQRRQRILHDVLSRACELTARSQSRDGGWLYTPDSMRDEGSVTVTQIQALRACRNAGITVSEKTVREAVGYIRKSANPDGSIRYRISSSGGRAPITAAAVAVLYNAGRYDDPLAEKALRYAMRTLPINGSGNHHHYYSQLYLSQALYQRGGEDWDDHYARLSRWLLAQQRADGSWMGDGVGTTYGAALALTVLQLPDAYLPIYQR